MEEKEAFLKVSPKYKFIYELGMPTGKKVRKSIVIAIVFALIFVLENILVKKITINAETEKAINILNYLLIIFFAFFTIKSIIHIIFQVLQYKNITYTFYSDCAEYKDTFWNQQTKVVRYENIKEIEVRKNVWDRLNKTGIVILYTSAEKVKSKGLVIYSVENVDKVYEEINHLIDDARKNTTAHVNEEETSVEK